MKKAYIMVVMFATLSVSTFSACGDTSTAPPPTVLNPDEDNSDGSDEGEGDETSEMTRIYDVVKKNQLAYIRSLQISSGAIKDNEQSNSRICPYFSNFAVMALLKNPVMENVEVVKKYITWYLNKLNRTNINPHTGQPEIIGSVYDYYGDTETTHGTYDSVDSYAATFLEIVMELAKLSEENKNWLQEKKDDISLVASAMINTIDTESFSIPTDFTSDDNDYLSIAKLDYPVKYLMDNCEVNMGLKAALWLKDNGLIDNAVDFSTFLAQNTASVKALYNGTVFRWNKGANGTGTPDLSKFYADAVCQLYPGLFQVIEPDSEIANKVYTQFNRNFGSWASGTTYDDYPWTIIAYAAATINDVTRVETYVKHIYSYNSKGQQKDRWYSAEAGSLLLAIDRIQNPIVDSKYSHIN